MVGEACRHVRERVWWMGKHVYMLERGERVWWMGKHVYMLERGERVWWMEKHVYMLERGERVWWMGCHGCGGGLYVAVWCFLIVWSCSLDLPCTLLSEVSLKLCTTVWPDCLSHFSQLSTQLTLPAMVSSPSHHRDQDKVCL